MRNRVALIGGFPPPAGGNSVHVKRLHQSLNNGGLQAYVFDPYNADVSDAAVDEAIFRYGPAGLFALFRVIRGVNRIAPAIVHFHVSALDNFLYAAPLLLLGLRGAHGTVLTIHSGSFTGKLTSMNALKKAAASRLLNSMNQIIAVSQEQKHALIDLGCQSARVNVIPAYLPPVAEKSNAVERLAGDSRRDGRKIIVTSGYGLDIYGFDQIITAWEKSSLLREQCALVICAYGTWDGDYMAGLQRRIAGAEHCSIVRDLSEGEFAWLLSQADMYVRATDRDGDAVAIREARHFGLSVVASDVVQRPDYCKLFSKSSFQSLVAALAEAMEGGASGGGPGQDRDYLEKILSVYSDAVEHAK